MAQPGDYLPDNQEYERRFLVEDASIVNKASSWQKIRQAYLWAEGGWAVRVRVSRSGVDDTSTTAKLTLKGPRHDGHRFEFETDVPLDAAEAVVGRAKNVIRKTRYSVVTEGDLWDIDVFEGDNEGLMIAEYEASENSVARVKKPWWAGEEVTSRPEYDNESLAVSPRKQ
ncbi:MAG: adenylate cyclase [Actinomycetia bacterium]|nr:adenylate cyclase [Actinomycetes bacterium]